MNWIEFQYFFIIDDDEQKVVKMLRQPGNGKR